MSDYPSRCYYCSQSSLQSELHLTRSISTGDTVDVCDSCWGSIRKLKDKVEEQITLVGYEPLGPEIGQRVTCVVCENLFVDWYPNTRSFIAPDGIITFCSECFKSHSDEITGDSLLADFEKLKITMAKRLPDTETHRFRIEIASASSNKLYIVSQQISNKQWMCSCPGWISRHKDCKHLKATEVERMKLEKAFGATNKVHDGPKGTADDWKNAFSELIPPEKPEEPVTKVIRTFKIKE